MTKAEEVLEALDTRCRFQLPDNPLYADALCGAHGRAAWMSTIPDAKINLKRRQWYRCETTGELFTGPAIHDRS